MCGALAIAQRRQRPQRLDLQLAGDGLETCNGRRQSGTWLVERSRPQDVHSRGGLAQRLGRRGTAKKKPHCAAPTAALWQQWFTTPDRAKEQACRYREVVEEWGQRKELGVRGDVDVARVLAVFRVQQLHAFHRRLRGTRTPEKGRRFKHTKRLSARGSEEHDLPAAMEEGEQEQEQERKGEVGRERRGRGPGQQNHCDRSSRAKKKGGQQPRRLDAPQHLSRRGPQGRSRPRPWRLC